MQLDLHKGCCTVCCIKHAGDGCHPTVMLVHINSNTSCLFEWVVVLSAWGFIQGGMLVEYHSDVQHYRSKQHCYHSTHSAMCMCGACGQYHMMWGM